MADKWWADVRREGVRVAGPEASPFLQGQLSQDVSALGAGGCTWSWVLAPNGKVDALVRVSRLADDDFLLDMDQGWGEAVRRRLERFRLRTKATVESVKVDVVAARGLQFQADIIHSPSWPAGEMSEYISVTGRIDRPAQPEPSEWEPIRIAAARPVMGRELSERTIPGETGLVPITVSFEKGCYTGQELVARIDSRGGNVPRHLTVLRSAQPLQPGSSLVSGGTVACEVTSSASGLAPDAGWVALGYLKRGFDPPLQLDDGEGTAVDVLGLPW